MSERGSFVTEYMYCRDCFEAAKTVLLGDDKYWRGVAIPSWTGCTGAELPIIAGKAGGTYSCYQEFMLEQAEELKRVLCHPLKMAIINDGVYGDGLDIKQIVIRPYPKEV